MVEGKYWKRKVDAVAQEYRKWRCYYKERNVRSVVAMVIPSLDKFMIVE